MRRMLNQLACSMHVCVWGQGCVYVCVRSSMSLSVCACVCINVCVCVSTEHLCVLEQGVEVCECVCVCVCVGEMRENTHTRVSIL